jgi:hypothetical protein
MGISKTKTIAPFPSWSECQDPGVQRYSPLPTPSDLRDRTLFGIPLKSALNGQELNDDAIQNYIDQSISELEHTLDLYITPVTFQEQQDYDRQLQFWSFGYVKVNHPNILSVNKFSLSFNNGFYGPPLVEIPLEFIHVQPLEATLQLVPAVGVTISGLLISIYTGLGFHAFNTQTISQWPGAFHINYTCGFEPCKVPAVISGLIENMAAYKVLSLFGPLIFPQNSVSVSTDGVSQSTGTMGPQFLKQRLDELAGIIQSQTESVKGYYERKFLVDYL